MTNGNSIDISFNNKEFMGHYSHLCLTSLDDYCLDAITKCVHIYFLTKPKTWVFRPSDICKKLNISERTYQRSLLKLEEKGYLYRIHNNFRYWKYIRCERPIKKEEAQKLVEPGWSLYARHTDALAIPATQTPLNKNINNIINNNNINLLEDKSSNISVPGGERQGVKKLKRRVSKENISLGLQKQNKFSKEYKTIAPKIKELLDFHSVNLHKYRINSGSYYRSADAISKLLQGKFFNNSNFNGRYTKYKNRKFTADEIKQVILRMTLASSLDYYPKDKTPFKSSFADLVYNPNISNEDYKSNFLYYFENEPKHYGNGICLIDDPDEEITTTFKSIYEESVVAGNKKNFNNVEENKFRTGAQKALEFYKNNRERMHIHNKRTYIREVWEAITKFNSLDKIYPGTFCSSKTWEHDVPVYLADQGILEQVRVL